VDHYVNLSDLQQVLGQYVNPSNLLISGGPLAVAGVVRGFITKNKIASLALAGSTIWFGVKTLSGPVMGLIGDQFGYLHSLIGN
jgi:hypothetical protein